MQDVYKDLSFFCTVVLFVVISIYMNKLLIANNQYINNYKQMRERKKYFLKYLIQERPIKLTFFS